MKTAVIIGNSDGIGLELTKVLLNQKYSVVGISKSESKLIHENYKHYLQDVRSLDYKNLLKQILELQIKTDLCVYCAGIGEVLDLKHLEFETKVFEVNLMAAVVTTEVVLTKMLSQGSGHFIGLSSIADSMISPESPSYSASKAGVSKFWDGLGLALIEKSVKISNIRFGFVNTKMAKAAVRPFMMSSKEAVAFILEIIKNPRVRATKPIMLDMIVFVLNLVTRLRLLF